MRQEKSGAPRKRANPEKEFGDNKFKSFGAKNEKQKQLFNALAVYDIVIAHGCAGTGKTAVMTSYAAQQLNEGKIKKIIVTRPAVEAAGESLGFLPGELDQKFLPFLTPVKCIFEEIMGKSNYEMAIKDGTIEAVPLAYMRGMTFKDSIVLADEMQGSSPEQMEMLCTRIGINSQLFIDGDVEQSDIRGQSGLEVAIKYMSWMPECKVVEFNLDDIVRSYLTSSVIQSFRKYKQDTR